MEKFMQRENGILGCAHPRVSITSRKTSEDMNFNDVFGGPPRRFSVQDVKLRYSFGETVESEEETISSPWSSLSEKPFFGKDTVPRRRHQQGDDFFDDIFRGDESYNSPRRTDRDWDSVFGSSPGSRILSPSRPLPPKADPAPTQFSLPAKLTKAMEIPTFASHGQHKMDGTDTNGLNRPHSPSSLSRISSQVFRSQDEYRQSPLSHEASFSSEDSPPTVLSDQKGNGENLMKDRRNVDGFGNHFHFSIYKWAGREVPMLLPLVGRDNMKLADGSKYDRSASSNGRIESKFSAIPKRQSMLAREPKAVQIEHEEELIQSKEHTKEWKYSIEDKEVHQISEPKSQFSANDVSSISGVTQNLQRQVKSVYEIDVQKKAKEKVPLKKEESDWPEPKTLRAFLGDKTDVQGKSEEKVPVKKEESVQSRQKSLHALFGDEIEPQANVPEIKESKKRILNGFHSSSHEAKTSKKNEGTGISSNNGTVDKSSLQAALVDPSTALGENRVRGKVREYVQIFNQEADSRPKVDLQRRSQSSRWKAASTDQKENVMNSNAENAEEKFNLHNVVKEPEASFKVNENLNNEETQHCINRSSTNQENGFFSETSHSDSTICEEDDDDPLEDDFLVQELSEDYEIVPKSEDPNDTKAINSKIQQWSSGKKGNIRSLLSTLQFVLWPESGWKPVALADMIETNAVKRSYQKALLCLHPDKLQQKGATFHQKYIAEKVFDILQEAWDQFNVLVPI